MLDRDRLFFYDRFAEHFDDKMNRYDLEKRLRVIFEDMLSEEELRGKRVLDAGCGTGWFSQQAFIRGANVISLDIGKHLLHQVKKKCSTDLVVGDICLLPFDNQSFDYVISTEVIEHTPYPMRALGEMYRVLREGGVLILTVPNRLWHFSVIIANKLKLRPYEGYENWVGWQQLRKWMKKVGFQIMDMFGFHAIPFVSPYLFPLIDRLDRYGRSAGPLMLNIAVKGLCHSNT